MAAMTKFSSVGLKELGLLQAISRKTFVDTFAVHNDPKYMASYLAKAFSDEQLTSEIQNPESRFYFAWLHDTETKPAPVGYIKLNWGQAQTEQQEESRSIELERIYVDSAYQGKRVGKALFEHAVTVARERESTYLWLGVWENNSKAIEFYKRQGFESFGTHIFEFGPEKQTDILMKLGLSSS